MTDGAAADVVRASELTPGEVTRPIFFHVGQAGEIVFYVLGTLTVALFGYGVWRRVSKYRRGRSADRWPTIKSAMLTRPAGGVRGGRGDHGSLAVVASNVTIGRRARAVGIAHFGVFWGFLVLFAGTVILTIDYDVMRVLGNVFGGDGERWRFFNGAFYKAYSVTLDVFALGAVVGLGYLMVRRGMLKPFRLNYRRAEEPEGGYSRTQFVLGDWLFAGGLMAILLTGLAEEGVRIRATDYPAHEKWSPIGWALAHGVEAVGIGAATATDAFPYLWWLHAVLALGFVAYIPYSKAMHMLADGVNLLAHDRTATLRLPDPQPDPSHAGYTSIEDFTWKELLDLDSCTKCGRCHEVCPARTGGAPLSPRDLILDLRQWVDTSSGGLAILDREDRPSPNGSTCASSDISIAGGVIPSQTLWACTTCMACVQACPVGIEHVGTIVQLRRTLVEQGDLEPSLQTALQNLAGQGNSFGKSARQRSKWTKTLEVPIKDARKEPVKYLWFVGDYASFDDRLAENSRLLAGLLTRAGVDFGILYEGEWNSGNDVRRVGEEGLFDQLVEHNIEQLNNADFVEIFTTDPHTLNALRNEYPARGGDYTVWHYTELLAHLIETGALEVEPLGLQVTYHDPCYLARYNKVTEAPRRILAALGCELLEMPRNKENTFCCGAGGGRIWMDDSGLTERPAVNRIHEATTLDVSHFVVSCPKDMTMYSDAAKTTGNDERLTVLDIVRLVDMAVRRPAPPEPETVGAPA